MSHTQPYQATQTETQKETKQQPNRAQTANTLILMGWSQSRAASKRQTQPAVCLATRLPQPVGVKVRQTPTGRHEGVRPDSAEKKLLFAPLPVT